MFYIFNDLWKTSISTAAQALAKIVLGAGTASLLLFGSVASNATPLTGDPQGNDFGWTPASTNLANSTGPGGYVLFNAATIDSITLDFFGASAGFSFFEIRIDDVATGSTGHPVVPGDTIHTGGVGVNAGATTQETFSPVNSFVDVRLALGGERDWDFDWTRFYVESSQTGNQVPVPAPLLLMSLGLAVLGLWRRKAA